jgi:hypothetical protein
VIHKVPSPPSPALCTDLTTDPVWNHKAHLTFSDALALVRRDSWVQEGETFCGSPLEMDTVKALRAFVESLTQMLC